MDKEMFKLHNNNYQFQYNNNNNKFGIILINKQQ
jgi:hypothetical protein